MVRWHRVAIELLIKFKTMLAVTVFQLTIIKYLDFVPRLTGKGKSNSKQCQVGIGFLF